MNKKLVTFIILSSFIFGGIGGWVLVRYVLPRLNQNSFFVRWNLLPQTAPIVITNQQVVHEDEGTDSIAAIQHSQPWVVGIVSPASPTQGSVLQGAGLTLTSDGLVATTKAALGAELKTGNTAVVFADGTVGHATVAAQDPASNLVFIKVAGVSGEPTASFDEPSQLELGERVIVLSPSLDEHQGVDNLTYLSSTTENLNPSTDYSTDTVATTFGIDGATGASGSAIVALDGNVEGLFDSSGVITSDTVKSAMGTYFASGKIEREELGLCTSTRPFRWHRSTACRVVQPLSPLQRAVQLPKLALRLAMLWPKLAAQL